MISKLNFSKGHNSVRNVGGVTELVLSTSSDYALIYIKLSETISKSCRVIERTRQVDIYTDRQTD